MSIGYYPQLIDFIATVRPVHEQKQEPRLERDRRCFLLMRRQESRNKRLAGCGCFGHAEAFLLKQFVEGLFYFFGGVFCNLRFA